MSVLIAFVVGIVIMVGLFSFFDSYPDPIYFETFTQIPPHTLGNKKCNNGKQPGDYDGYYRQDAIF